MGLTRKEFLRGGVAAAGMLLAGSEARAGGGAGAAGPAEPAGKDLPALPAPSQIHFPVLRPGEYDDQAMWKVLKARHEHKFIFESVQPNLAFPGLVSLYSHVQNALNSGEFSFGWGRGRVGSAAVLVGPSICLAFNDAMWAKYSFGALFRLVDASGNPETANVYYRAQTSMSFDGDPGAGGNVYQDWSAEACIRRGTRFMVCHNAINNWARVVALQMRTDPAATVAEWKANMLPGFMIVPAGVGVLHAAMELGWKMMVS